MSALRGGPAPNARRVRRPKGVTQARWVAWQVVRRTFDEGAYTDRAFTAEAERFELDPRDRAFAQHLAFGTVQQAKRLDHVIGTVGKRPLRKVDPPVLHALRVGLYELLMSREPSAHAAVDQAVELVRGVVGERAVAFTNAVLRRAQVDGADILGRLDPGDDGDVATLLSMPEWVVARLRAQFGADGVAALEAQNVAGATTALRLNPLRAELATIDERLAASGVELCATSGPFADALPEARLVAGSTAKVGALVEEGLVAPQSLASMLVATAVDPQPGERVLDMCAAPGGKTVHMAALMGGVGRGGSELVACELHQHRADSITVLAERCNAGPVDVRVGDATALTTAEVGTFDRVLVDAPCSGIGVLGRRPDARWKRQEEDLEGLVDLQRRLLAVAASLVRPGGVVVYSTCTLLRDENEQVVVWALAELPLVAGELPAGVPTELHLPGSAHLARTWPQRHDTDGFFIAHLRRTAEGE